MDEYVYLTVAGIVTFIGLIVVGYEVEREKMDSDVYFPLSMLAALCGVAWPIVIALVCAFGICYIPLSLGKLISKCKKKADFKKKLRETPIDKIKKR
jgi:hypothetical protein